MSLLDNARELATRLLTKFGVTATITRTTGTPALANRLAGTRGSTGTTTVRGVGILGNRKTRLADGTIRQQSTATINIAPVKGDRLTIGTKAFEIVEIEEINPDGQTPMVWTVLLT